MSEEWKKKLQLDESNLVQVVNNIITAIDEIDDQKYSSKRKADDLKTLNALLDHIQNPPIVQENKYQIPLKYLHEAIILTVSHFDDALERDETFNNAVAIGNIISTIETYLDCYNVFDKEYGDTLAKIWDSPDYCLAIHGTLLATEDDDETKELASSYFRQGLRTSQQQKGHLDIKYTTMYQGEEKERFTFLDALIYMYGYGGPNILLAIPIECFDIDNPAPMFGSHSGEITGEEYILPEYIVGAVSNTWSYDDRHIIFSNHSDMEKYEFCFENGTGGLTRPYHR